MAMLIKRGHCVFDGAYTTSFENYKGYFEIANSLKKGATLKIMSWILPFF